MISYLTGKVSAVSETFVILEVNQIGYQVFLNSRDLANLPREGENCKVFTHLYLKEDLIQLYGFLDQDDLGFFQRLINVNGIGPKATMGILSMLSADDLRFAILSDDVKTITKVPGIGTKTAQRLILDLKDKISLEETFERKLSKETEKKQRGQKNQEAVDEAVLALTALGYSNSEALRAVRGLEIREDWKAEDVIREALKAMAFV
ncbi:MAG: Holliday junction branch migration protein RuvA [Lachnospiraceae bacterium]|nr:Holliday junction branch migration protein RuvA [Robinsoniella sp.]MDY3767652.1 Holliday junction branch migration protein RuvA [Lachnospiraceae bacterium]